MSLPAEQIIPFPTPDPAAQEAAEWVVRLDRGLAPGERAAFAAWRAADPRHAEAFARADYGWGKLGQLGAVRVLADEADEILRHARGRHARRRAWRHAIGAIAAAVAVGFFAWSRPDEAHPANYQVLASTSREMKLPDGSLALLNGDSQIETAYTEAERRVRLVRGEALFTVARNPARPFFVNAGPVTVRAVGTAFNVRMGISAVEVIVTEGKVRVDDHEGKSLLTEQVADAAARSAGFSRSISELSAGQRVTVNLVEAPVPAAVATVAPLEIDQALAWQSTRLAFNDTPLDEVVAAFNRYNGRQLTLGDPLLRLRTITGVFRADNLDGFIRLIEAGADVRTVERSANETVLLSRN